MDRDADGVFEPVRRDGNLNRKFHGNKRTLDWWTVDKPLDWTPADEGKQVSLNHDYGQKAQPKVVPKDAESAPDKGSAPASQAAPSKPGDSGKSTISRGAPGLWEHMTREKAGAKPAASTQAARILGEWERGQGIDPNQGSGHERRPPSSSKDAAELGKAESDQGVGELVKYLEKMRDDPPWGKKQTPLEKVQGVTHPVGKEVGLAALQELLKGSGLAGKAVGKAMGPAGILWDVVANSDEAW